MDSKTTDNNSNNKIQPQSNLYNNITRLPCAANDPRLVELAKAYETILRIVENIDQPGCVSQESDEMQATTGTLSTSPQDDNVLSSQPPQNLTPLTSFRSGIEKTPMRAAKAIMEMTQGYEGSIEDLINDAIFESESSASDLIIVCDIEFTSLCEHHLLPFSGHAHIGYLPSAGRILGLSKFARITNLFSQRLQVQEILTKSISSGLFNSKLAPHAVIVMVEAEHSCMSCRGVKKIGSSTITTAIEGDLTREQRAEFLALVNRPSSRR